MHHGSFVITLRRRDHEPEVKVLIGRILEWWRVTILSQIPGSMLILCHIMRHTSEEAQ